MTAEKTKLGITRFFSGLFKNFGKILLTNLLFAVPLVIFSVLFYWINIFTGANLWFIALLPIIFVFPFFSGVTLITRNIVRGDEENPVFMNFVKGFKENFLLFLIHGIVLYCAIFFCYSSITLYWQLGVENGIFFIPFGIVVIIAVVILFMFYNIPVMTVTFDLSLKNIYKNSFLMSFGELKNNFFSTLGLFLLFIFCATIFLASPNAIVLVIVSLTIAVILVPSLASYIMNFYVYKDMENLLVNKSEMSDDLKRQIENQKKGLEAKKANEKPDFSVLDLDEKKDGEEYLFFNGKMIKRKVLIEMKKKQENSNE